MDIGESGTGIRGWQQGGGLNIKEGCTVVIVVVVVCIGIRLVVCRLIIIPMIDIRMSGVGVVVALVVIVGRWFFGSFGNDQTRFISFATTMCRWGGSITFRAACSTNFFFANGKGNAMICFIALRVDMTDLFHADL